MPHRAAADVLSTLLTRSGPVLLDGGLTTQLEAGGHDLSDDLWSARLLADDPDAIEEAHLAFLRAGARVVTSASYQASRAGFARAGVPGARADELLRRSVLLAQAARERFEAESPEAPRALVAASVGPYGAMLAGGQEYTGEYGALSGRELEGFHEERLAALLEAGPDCVACETIPRADEAAALAAVLDRLRGPEAWITFACRDERSTVHGEPVEEAVAAALSGTRVVAVGVNCTAPEYVEGLLRRARSVTDRPLVAYPNSGQVWDGEGRVWTRTGVASFEPVLVRAWIDAGARLVGGCCGIGPAGIAAIAPVVAGAD